MRLETAQVLELLGISKETLRHWKKVLPPLEGRDGRSAGYTFDEVIALALMAAAVRELQVPISRFSPVAHRIFQDVCAHVEDAQTTTVLCVTLGDVALYPIDKLPTDATLMLVRLAPTIRKLRQKLAPETLSDSQMSLDFDGQTAPRPPTESSRPTQPVSAIANKKRSVVRTQKIVQPTIKAKSASRSPSMRRVPR
jgi:hypothetical protein